MITLYKKGSTHIVKGVECEIKNFNIDELESAKKEGYVTDPKDLNKKPKRKSPKKEALKNEN